MNWTNEENNNTGVITRENIYNWIVNEKGVAYVKDCNGNKANLKGEISAKVTQFVKTYTDNVTTDNLLKLPECKI